MAPRTDTLPSPLNFGTSMLVKTIKKKSSWFRCNAGDFEDECPRIKSEPFISLPVDPFARYTIPSRRRKNTRPQTPLHFPFPPPRSPLNFCQAALPSPPISPTSSEIPSTSMKPLRGERMAASTQRNQEEFKSKLVDAKLAALSLTCSGYIDELDEASQYQEYSRRQAQVMRDDWSDRGTIFTLFGDAKEWEEFEEALFYLKPSRYNSFNDVQVPSTAPSSLPSSHPSSSSLAFSSASSASSVYSTMTSPDSSFDYTCSLPQPYY
ncbi:hypothetical protein JCM3765_005288 [Sporobolomyces pararoseus]